MPTSVRRLVEARIAERNATIELKLGVFPPPKCDPLAFWGASKTLARLADGAS